MSPLQYKHAIKKLGLSQRKAGKFLGVNERTSRRWIEHGPVPHAVGLLLRTMIKQGLSPDQVE